MVSRVAACRKTRIAIVNSYGELQQAAIRLKVITLIMIGGLGKILATAKVAPDRELLPITGTVSNLISTRQKSLN